MAIIIQQTPVTGTSQTVQVANDEPMLHDFDPGPFMVLAIIIVAVAMFKVILVIAYYAFKFAIGIAIIFFSLKFLFQIFV